MENLLKLNGLGLKNISDQNEKLCLIAVTENGKALKYVQEKYQTFDVCLAAVTNYPLASLYIKSKILQKQICIISPNALIPRALESDKDIIEANKGRLLPFSLKEFKMEKKQSELKCVYAVMRFGSLIYYVRKQTEEIVIADIIKHKHHIQHIKQQNFNRSFMNILQQIVARDRCKFTLSFKYIQNPSYEISRTAAISLPENIRFIPEIHQTDELVDYVLKINGKLLRYVIKQTKKRCLIAVKQNGLALKYVINQDSDICLAAVKCKKDILQFVKEQSLKICIAAVKHDITNLRYVKPEFWIEDMKKESLKFYGTSEIPDKFVPLNEKMAEEMIIITILKNKKAIKNVPVELQTERVYKWCEIWDKNVRRLLGRELKLPSIYYIWFRIYNAKCHAGKYYLTNCQRYTFCNLGKMINCSKYVNIRIVFF